MKKKAILAMALSLLIVATTAFTGFGKTSLRSNALIDSNQTLNLSLSDITTLNSLLVTDTYSLTVLNACMEGLTRNENDGKKDMIKPAGASKWEVSKDGITWTFYLRNNTWSDGKKVVADDYVYAWKKLLDPKTASSYASFIYCVKGAKEYNTGKGKESDVGVKAVGQDKFVVTLKQPTSYFLQISAFKSLLPLRKDVIEKAGEKYGQDPSQLVYNGPFVVEQWVKGSKVVLKKNPKYWDAASVKLDTVNLLNIIETQTETKMFESGQIDEITLPDPEYLSRVKSKISSGSLRYFERNDPETRYLAFNTQDKQKLLSNAKIRQALSISINRESVTKNVYKHYTPAYGWIPNGVAMGTIEFRKRIKEPVKTLMKTDPKTLFKQGLKELGLDPNGKYTISFLQSGQSTFKRTLSEYYQNIWQTKLGVTVKIDLCADFAELSSRCEKGDYQVTVRDWVADFNDPISFFGVFRSADPNNTALYKSSKYDQLIAKAEAESEPAKRLEYERQAEILLTVTDCAVAPVYYGGTKKLVQSYVKGLQYPLFISSFDFKYAYIDGRK